MEIQDARGRPHEEITVRLTKGEMTELLVAASKLDGNEIDHALVRDLSGTTLAIYAGEEEGRLLERHVDWWTGPLILIAVLLLAVGAFTVARGLLSILF